MNQKRRINVCTIGHIDHGKTTLTSALTKIANKVYGKKVKFFEYKDIDKAPEERQRGITINAAHVPYCTEKSDITHVDCPGHADYIKNMIVGATQVDLAILLIDASAKKFIGPQTREHALLIKIVGVPSICVYINKLDAIKEDDRDLLIEIIKEDVSDLLGTHGYKNDNIHFVSGSALKSLSDDESEIGSKSIEKLLDIIDNAELRKRDNEGPFLMQVENTCTITGRGTVATGRVVRGKISKDTKVEIIGTRGYKKETVVTGLEQFGSAVDVATSGFDVGMLLRGIDRNQISRGFIISSTGSSIQHINVFRCYFYILKKDEMGRGKSFTRGYSPQLFARTLNITCTFKELFSISKDGEDEQSIEIGIPGESVTAEIELIYSAPLEKDLSIIVREGGNTVGFGIITSVIK